MEDSPEKKVERFIKDNKLIPAGSVILVAVSGGQDSVALLYILNSLKEKLDFSIHVAHLDHGLREESAADAEFVAWLSEHLALPFTIEKRDVTSYRVSHRLSLEEAAREVRYSFLAEVAEKVGALRVAVAHTLSDHLETILMHIIRGSGLKGLVGLRPLTEFTYPLQFTLIRPLLSLKREETGAYCQSKGINFRVDKTNLLLYPFRNRIRHELLPLLKNYNPRIEEALCRLSNISSGYVDFVASEAEKTSAFKIKDGQAILDRQLLSGLPRALRAEVMLLALEGVLGDLKDIEASHVEAMLKALEKPGAHLNLPGGLNLQVEYARALLGLNPSAPPELSGEARFWVPGEIEFCGWRFEGRFIPPSEVKFGDKFTAFFDAHKTGNELLVRGRRRGDHLWPLGMGAPKRLSRFMIDSKVPRNLRGQIPVILSGEDIIWAVGLRPDERFKVSGETERVLALTARPPALLSKEPF